MGKWRIVMGWTAARGSDRNDTLESSYETKSTSIYCQSRQSVSGFSGCVDYNGLGVLVVVLAFRQR